MNNHYHAEGRFKKKAATMLFLMLGVMLVILSNARKQARAYDTTVALTVSEECILYQTPSMDAKVVGTYCQAVLIYGDPVGGGWFHVILPGNELQMDPDFSGYMRMEDLLLYDVLMERTDMPYFCPVGEALEDTDLLKAPGGPDVIARVPFGAVMEILGVQSDWLHVRIGETIGFLPRAHVMYTGEKSHLYYGPPPRGYMVTDPEIPWEEEDRNVFLFPGAVSQEEPWIYSGCYAVFSQENGYLQFRQRMAGRIGGFIRDHFAHLYWMEDMRVTEDIRLEEGNYTVGLELPTGLYTFSAPDGRGSMETTGESPLLYHAFESAGEPYTMYLTEGVSVSILGDGVLVPMDSQNALSEANGWRIEGNGRFMAGENLIHPQGENELSVRVKPGEKVGYYAISTLDDEMGLGERPRRTMVIPQEEEYTIYIEPGMFVEFRNCTVWFDFGNG